MAARPKGKTQLLLYRSPEEIRQGRLHRPAGRTNRQPKQPSARSVLVDAQGQAFAKGGSRPKLIVDRSTPIILVGRDRSVPSLLNSNPSFGALPDGGRPSVGRHRNVGNRTAPVGGGDPIPPIAGTTPQWRGDWLTALGPDPAPLDGGNYNNYQCPSTNLLNVIGSGVTSANFPTRALQVVFDGTGGGGGGNCQMARVAGQWSAPVLGSTPYVFIRWYWYCPLANWDSITGSATDLGQCHGFQEGDNGRWYTNTLSAAGGKQPFHFQFPAQSFPKNRYQVPIDTFTLWMKQIRLTYTTSVTCKVSLRVWNVVTGALAFQDSDFRDNNNDPSHTLNVDNPDLAVTSGSDLQDLWIGNNGIGVNDQTPGVAKYYLFAPGVRVSANAGDWIGSWTLANG